MTNKLRLLISCLLLSYGIVSLSQNSTFIDQYETDVRTCGNAAKMIVEKRQFKEGVDILNALIERVSNASEYPRTSLATYHKCRALGYMKLGQYANSVADYQMALNILEKEGVKGKTELSDTWYQLSIAFYNWGKQKEAMSAANNSVSTAEEYFGKIHSKTLEAYSLRSNYEGFYNDKDGALRDRCECFDIVQRNVEKNFTYLTSQERTAYWDKYMPETSLLFTFGHKLQVEPSDYTDAMYDQQLLAKGLLLTAESALQRTIDENTTLQQTFLKIRNLRKKAMDANINAADAERFIREADRLEREVTSQANEIKNFVSFLSVHSTDIKAKLSENDVAIEFVDYRVGKDSVMYAALVISPKWQHVRFIPLVEQRELLSNKENLVQKIWDPIFVNIGNQINRIYFAPTGLLYQLPIESHLMKNGSPIGQSHAMYRLSSTRWLALNEETALSGKIALYGDLLYDASIQEMREDMKLYPEVTTKIDRSGRGASDAMGLTPLPATREEVNRITQIFSEIKVKPQSYTGSHGTETSFKSLSGKRFGCIHIATHGFFNGEIETKDPLSRAGLYMAGANNQLTGDVIPNDVEDGILTASEVSSLDLKGLKLLCLSACETGLGDISSDGVFGLQRGFKKAGAKSILMSLWKVDDESTCKLMTEFYSNWIGKKMTKHGALEAAKKTVRETKGWEDPKYWAAFILLDGLD